MLLSKKTVIQLNETEVNLLGHMNYAAYKLWNICNYERYNYKELGLEEYPDWYYQKSHHRSDMWFKALPSQTAQEVCKLLDKSWKSFYRLKKTGGVENPNPPGYKHKGIAVTYMQNGIVHEAGTETVRLTLSRQLKEYMKSAYHIHETYLYLKNRIFKSMDRIKQIHLYPPEEDGKCTVAVVYEIEDAELLPENGHYLSVDLGLHNLMTCYDSVGKSFILGRKYLSICRRYEKEIARVQSQWASAQVAQGIRYPKGSKHLLRLYKAKKESVRDYLHKLTRYVAEYCKKENIHTVVVGDITGIRKGKDLGKSTNQKLHGLPYVQIYNMLEYKLSLYGIRFVKQTESYSSQCSPFSKAVSKEYAVRTNRCMRGLYKEQGVIFQADAVGAYNILRKYFAVSGGKQKLSVSGLSDPKVIKVAV